MSIAEPLHPRVGVAAVIRGNQGQLIVGKRLGSHGKGTWQFPGGHLEYGEEVFACAERETLEETGLRVKATKMAAVTNSVFVAERKHYITLFVECEMSDSGATPEVMEPEKCESWHWLPWKDLCEWVDHDEDPAVQWADKKCFLPIIDLVHDNRDCFAS